jgi:aspartate racemase
MAKHIGIVACSAPGAALCYATICAEAPQIMGPNRNPEISMHMVDFSEHVRYMERDDWDGVAMLMLASVKRLAATGANFAICPDNTCHIAMPKVEGNSPIPWLHIADVVAEAAKNQGYRRLGLLGTRWLVESPVYPEHLAARNIEWLLPTPEDRAVVNRIIFDELVLGKITREAQAHFMRIIEAFKSINRCDAVILGCTEIPLAVTPEASPLPALDSTRLLARAALKMANQG